MKKIGYGILALINAFVLGGYTASEISLSKPVELYEWFLTSAFTVMFFVMALTQQTKQ